MTDASSNQPVVTLPNDPPSLALAGMAASGLDVLTSAASAGGPALGAIGVVPVAGARLSGRYEVLASALQLSTAPLAYTPVGSGYAFELRVDVDGINALSRISGVVWMQGSDGDVTSRDLLGTLTLDHTFDWNSARWTVYRSDDSDLPGVSRLFVALAQNRALLLLTSGARQSSLLSLPRVSEHLRDVTIELDIEENVSLVPSYDTASNNDRPPGFANTTLDLVSAFGRAGIGVTMRLGGIVPSAAAQAVAATWSNIELHDALAQYWESAGQGEGWRLWLIGARLHDEGTPLGGIMFDGDDSPDGFQRQGAAVFVDAAMHQPNPPNSPPNPYYAPHAFAAQRQLFFNLMHEAGHAFNLAHSWEKRLGQSWRREANRPLSPSWMNYPFNISGFWRRFEFNFDQEELLFLRHAPSHLVAMGGSPWFVDHADFGGIPGLTVALFPRSEGYEYLEPVYITGRITNLSRGPVVVPGRLDTDEGSIVVLLEGVNGSQVIHPYMQRASNQAGQVLLESDFVDFTAYVGASPGEGNHFIEPGDYKVTVLVVGDRVLAASEPTTITVQNPDDLRTYRARTVVGNVASSRVFAFQGSHQLTAANQRLAELRSTLDPKKSALARHLSLVLGNAYARTRRRAGKSAVAAQGSQTVPLDVVEKNVAMAARGYEDFLQLDDAGLASAAASSAPYLFADVALRYAHLLHEDGQHDRLKTAADKITNATAQAGANATFLSKIQNKLDEMLDK